MDDPQDIVEDLPKPIVPLAEDLPGAVPGDAPDPEVPQEILGPVANEDRPVPTPEPRLYRLRPPGLRPRFTSRTRRPAVLRSDCPPDLRSGDDRRRSRPRLR
ncbi:MAG: hypothetical protein ACYDGR_00905 [Candidatus Dormibacteria bacterium]